MTRGASVLVGLALGAAITGCVVHRVAEPRLTGTCGGACAHYIECKAGHPEADRERCVRECPDVFADETSLMGYESLECRDAVEYVDGTRARAASSK